MPDDNGNCNCGCGVCGVGAGDMCCTCPPKFTSWGAAPSWDYRDHIMYCADAVTALNDERSNRNLGSCLGTYGGPLFPNVVLGGYDCETDGNTQTCHYMNATALIITLPIDNHVDESLNGPAEAWETVFLDFMAGLENSSFTYAYSAERSISVCALVSPRLTLGLSCLLHSRMKSRAQPRPTW
jgi:hypothetical protein